MRRGFGFLWVALTGILLAIVGTVAYQAGWAAGAATQLPAGAAAAAAPYYYYGPHDGFGFFGFFWFLFFLFLLFVLFRALRFGRGWGYGGGGWGYKGYRGGDRRGGPPPHRAPVPGSGKSAHRPTRPAPPPDHQHLLPTKTHQH